MFADDDDDEMLCPLCMEDLDLTDRCFHPCPCGYQMCSFCWNRIMNEDSTNPPRCPACRKSYEEEDYVIDEPTEEQLTKMQQKKQRERQKKLESKESKEAQSRKHLANVRVIQRNLVYITNLPVHMAKEDLLRRPDNFGQYGKIVKVVINKNVYNVNSPAGPSVSVYITYSKKEDALFVIQSVDNCLLDNRVLRASFGTTKYCTYFLRGVSCSNPDCMYLHELGGEKDSYTKEDMAQGKHHFHDPSHPAQPIASGFGRPIIPRSQQLLAVSGGAPTETDPEEKILRNSVGAVLPPAPTAPVWKVPATTPTESPALNPVEWPSAGAAATIKPKPLSRSQPQPQVSILPATASWGKGSLKASTDALVIPDLPVPEKKPETIEEKKQPQITILKHDDKAKKQKETEPKRSQTPQLPITPPLPTTSPSLPSPKSPLTIDIGNAPPILATWDDEEETVPTPAPIASKPATSSVVATIEHSVPVIPVERDEELDFDPWKESAQGLEDYEEDFEPEVEEIPVQPQGARSRFGFAQNAWTEEEVKPKSPEATAQPTQSEDLQQSFRKLLPDINISFSVQQSQPQPQPPQSTQGSWGQPAYFNTWMQFPPGIPAQYPAAVAQDQIWRKPNQPTRTTPPPGLPIPKSASKSPGPEESGSGFVDSAIIGAGVAIKTLEEASWGLPSGTPYHPFPSVTSPPPGLGNRVQIFPETQVIPGQQNLPKNTPQTKPPSPAPTSTTPPPAPGAETESKKQRKLRNKQAQQAKQTPSAPVASQVKQKGSNGSTKSKEVKKPEAQPEPIIESNDAEEAEEAPQEVPPEKTMTDEEKKRERALRKKQRKEQEKLEKQKREQEQRERKKQQEREKQERLREQKEKEQREREQREREQRELKEQREREQRELREQREREQREREQREKEAAEKAANKQKKKQQRAQQQAQNNHASNHQNNLTVPHTQPQQLSPRRGQGQNSQNQHQNNQHQHHNNQNGIHKANDKSHHPTTPSQSQQNNNIQSFHPSNLDRTSPSPDSAARPGGSPYLLDNLNTNTSALDATTHEVETLEKQVEIAKQEVKALADRLMELRQKTKLGGDH